MHRSTALAWFVVALLFVACAPTPPTPPPTQPPPSTPTPTTVLRSGAIRAEVPSEASVHDLPWLMAWDALGQLGYTLQPLDLDDNDLLVAALDKGDLDLGWLTTQSTYSAIAKGAKIVQILDRSENANLLVTKQGIKTCSDLNRKAIAVPGISSPSTLIVAEYVARNCPGTVPEKAVLSGSARTAALLTGAVDGAVQDIDAWVKLERERPGEFRVLVPFGREFPEVAINVCVASRTFTQRHPQMVEDIIQTVMLARRSLQDQATLQHAMQQYLDYTSQQASESAKAYLAFGTWDVQGVLDSAKVQATLSFLQQSGAVPPTLNASDVADLSYYRAALAELDKP